MKKLLTLFAISLAVVLSSCSTFDDEAIWNKLDDHESRISRLEEMCREMNSNIDALQTIVTALQTNDYVTSVTPVTKDGETVGYTITFTKSDPITIYHGTDGKDGANGKDGKDGYTPIIGVKQDADGIYYWTLDGEWLLDENGNKIKAVGIDGKDGQDGEDGKDGQDGADGTDGVDGVDGENGADGKDGADGITPLLKIENNYWYISYDNGASWTQLGKATGEDGKDGADGKDGIDGANGSDGADGKDGDSFFQSVTQDEQFVYFTLADGTVITLPKGAALDITFAESDLVVMSTDSTREIDYTVTSVTEKVTVEVTSSADIRAKVVTADATGKRGSIKITTGSTIDEYSKVIVFVSNGDKVIMRSITFEEAGLQVEENATKFATAEGGEMTLEFLSNVECEVVIPEDAQSWISVVPATRALEKQTITLKLEPNEGAARSAELIVESVDGKLSLTYTITQEPNLDYQLALEREALIAIYNALDGDNWTNNENWCSDKPVSEWYGIEVARNGIVFRINLSHNNLSGSFPKEICKFTELEAIGLDYNDLLVGIIPDEIAQLKHLRQLTISNTNIERISDQICELNSLAILSCSDIGYKYTIPQNIGMLSELQHFSATLASGSEIPHSIVNCKKLTQLHLKGDGSQNISETIFECKNLESLALTNFQGSLSNSIENLQELSVLKIEGDGVSGVIPNTIGKLKKLQQVTISKTAINGNIPDGIFSAFDNNRGSNYVLDLSHNKLSGEVPQSISYYMTLFEKTSFVTIYLHDNCLTSIPESVQNHPMWNMVWPYIITQNYINHKDILLPGLHLSGCDIDGREINSEADYAKYDYTILWQFAPEFAVDPFGIFNVYEMNDIYDKYKNKNIKFIYMGSEWNTEEELRNFRDDNDVMWQVFNVNRNASRRLLINYGTCTSYLPSMLEGDTIRGNQVCVVDKGGNIVYSSILDGDLHLFLEKTLDGAGSDLYQSSDYSSDGNVTTLQTATKGNGIDIVLMGDAYSDRQIADGTYMTDMEYIYNNLFTEEPYKSFKDHFNVHYVNVVSATEGYEYGNTALDGYFGDGTLVGGNDNAVFDYALNAISEEEMDEALIIVAMNSDNYAGTCYMYYPESVSGTYGSGPSVAYFPRGGDAETFAQLLHHEACGHGFAKLADEYAYEYMGAVPSDYISQITSQQNGWGWWKNVDFTSDTSAIRWSNFINDARYANEGLGVFEGGLTYWSGVWRPTENSIMRYNTGGFNAPSREAIYYRIHKLAYGDSWEYDYEEFVEWDAINRTAAAAAKRKSTKPATYKPTHAPIIVNKSWRDAK